MYGWKSFGLVNVHLDDGTPLVSGRKVTAFTNEAEGNMGLKDQMPFLLESRLRETGINGTTLWCGVEF